MVMMMVAAASNGLCQILNIRQLAVLRGFREISRKLAELICLRSIAFGLSRLGGALQVGRDLLGNLRVLGRIRLLKLLKRAHQLRKGREIAVI